MNRWYLLFCIVVLGTITNVISNPVQWLFRYHKATGKVAFQFKDHLTYKEYWCDPDRVTNWGYTFSKGKIVDYGGICNGVFKNILE